MKKLLLLAVVALLAIGTTFALDLKMDAERDAFYNTLTGPADGYIYLGMDAQGIDQGGVEDEMDLSAFVWFAWDTTFFYCYAEITDDIILVNNTTTYENDAMELKIDPDPYSIDENTTGVAAFRMSAWSADEADEPTGSQSVDSGEAAAWPWELIEGEDYARQEIVTADRYGYNLEFRIPFEVIQTGSRMADPAIGNIMGMAVNVMDNDATNRESVLRWASNMSDLVWNEPKRHGTVTFLEGNKVSLSTENAITGVDTNTANYNPPATGVATNIEVPTEFNLAQNYPNPFNPTTTIPYSLPAVSNVMLKVYDLNGREVATVIENELQQAGEYNITFDASELSSGVYLYQLQTSTQTFTKKMTLLR